MGEARELMDRITGAAMGQNFETLASLYTPDAVITDPMVGEVTGGIVEYFKSFTDAFPDIAFQSEASHESGNVAIDEGFVTGTNTGPIALPTGETLPPTGKSIRVRSCDVVTVENGLAVRHNFYYDQMELLSQLGLVPENATA
jgi:ketosteroid isomerase-like protein